MVRDDEEAVERMNQPAWRKEEYRKALAEVNQYGLTDKNTLVKVFMKNETYEDDGTDSLEYKYPRGIYARVDEFKMFCGAAFQCVSEVVFSHRDFIKKTDVRDRPKLIASKLREDWYTYETDFSSMEGSISRKMFRIEFMFYRHILPNYTRWGDIWNVLAGVNNIRGKDFLCRIRACRMSGEMNTSVGNGLINWSVLRFVAWESGADIRLFVEGDDGIFTTSRRVLEPVFSELGFKVKLIEVRDFRHASFCGLRMSSSDDVLVDPRKILVNFPWSNSQLARGSDETRAALLRGKAECLVYEYPNCPIVTELGRVFLGDGPIRVDFNWYKQDVASQAVRRREETAAMLARGISMDTRFEFEDYYGIPVDLQLQVERELREDKWNFRQSGIQLVLESLTRSRDFYARFSSTICDRHADGWEPVPI